MSAVPVRDCVRILLVNDRKELLLMGVDDPKTTPPNGKYNGKFWFPIGGKIENNESLEQAAERELFEESGLCTSDVTFGPIVWHGTFELILSGTLTLMKQRFIVARTERTEITCKHLTPEEKTLTKGIEWFSLERIRECPDPVYPAVLMDIVSPILDGSYPDHSMEIDLAKQP